MTDIISVREFEDKFETDSVPPEYESFREREGIPVHSGLAVNDINDLATGEWNRTSERGALINLYGMEGIVDLQLHELTSEGETSRQHHLYEEIVFVTNGNGATAIGTEDEETVFEWSEGALFVIPQNTPYRHVNLSNKPARLVSQTLLPHLLTLLQDHDLIFNPDRNLWKQRGEEFYSAEGSIHQGEDIPVVWEANFVPDISKFDKLETWEQRGAGGASVRFPLSNTSMFAHISEFPVGTYKKAHRHRPGANVGILSGEGYSLMWREGWGELVKIPWSRYSFFTPPARWYHQHFNTGQKRARYFAIHSTDLGTLRENGMFDALHPDNQIEYTDEAPIIREEFETALREDGLSSKMPEECYTNPDFQFEHV